MENACKCKSTFDTTRDAAVHSLADANENSGELLYGQVENILAKVIGIKSEGRSAMKARLRHLRNIGVPELPRPGSGQKVLYSRKQAMEMLFALGLENVGQTPRTAAMLAKDILRHLDSVYWYERSVLTYILIRPAEEGGVAEWSYCLGSRELRLTIDKQAIPIFSVINVSAFAFHFEDEWDLELAREAIFRR